ncbi:Zn-dependent exopeptidase [Rhizodiscina lignyota]|uniref:Peptide hydrolase n=1 Tax=Rhizodiscina lignyota TaxID=1504668 RepID=A0A9P4I699_9PEZI|nr:Zn-dependent exopeptidase [Rhizodiscina lignyota]
MKLSTAVTVATAVATASALSVPHSFQEILDQRPWRQPAEQFLIELEPGKTQWVTEDQKWELRRQGLNFMDITETEDLGSILSATNAIESVTYPSKPAYNKTVTPLLESLSKKQMHQHLETFTAFHTRYYRSEYGAQSSAWLLAQVNATLADAGALEHGASVSAFPHSWGQASVIATIPGKSDHTVVIGAHQDSINLFLPSLLSAPGADDDGSGTVTILEALRVLLTSEDIVAGNATNTVEFHWYSAEEGGLLGSQAIFQSYEKAGKKVKAMLQQDMTGYVQKTLDAGEPESVGVITDYVDPGLTTFIKEVITEYCDIPYIETKCGYACSDHASASKAGYPSAFVIESDFKYSDTKIHTSEDKIEYLSFDHMLQHAKLTLGLAYELAMAKF